MEQQDLELFNKKYERVFHQLYEKTFSFLDSQSLVNSLTVNKDFYHLLNQYFKNFLTTNNLIGASDIPDPESMEEDHYLKLFRSFYTREVLVGHLSNVKQSYSELQLVRYPRCSTYGVKDFSLGSKFAVFHLFNNDIVFLKSEEYLNPLFNMKNINTKNIRKNITKFSTNAKDLFYMNTAGHLHTIFYNPEAPSHELTEGVLDLTINHPLKDFDVSYVHGILLLKGAEQKNQKKNEEQKEDNTSKRVIQDIRHFDIHNITPEEFNAPQKVCKVDGLDDQDVSSLQVGNNTAYFIADNSKLFECDFAEINNEKYKITPYEPLKNKMIRKIWGGYNHYFVLEQNEVGSIDTWTQEEILQWSNTKDFEEYRNIIKYENISGKELLKADKNFLVDRLGMMREDLQIKFLNNIQNFSKKTFKKPKIYAWGNNTFGQLGINTGHLNVNFPHEVTIPELTREDVIVDIKCGWKQSVILTQKGNLFVTEVLAKKAPKEKEEEEETKPSKGEKAKKAKKEKEKVKEKEKEKEKEEEEETKPAKGDKGKKGKKKEPVEVEEEKKAAEKPLNKWFDLTPTCETLRDGRQYRVIQVSLNKENIAVLGAYLGNKKKRAGEEDEEKAGSKFKGSDHIYHRILWDKKFKKEDFAVGYEDRFLGILEIPFEEFNLKTDIPMHRIKYFKQNGEIVWDRVHKVNKL